MEDDESSADEATNNNNKAADAKKQKEPVDSVTKVLQMSNGDLQNLLEKCKR